MVTILGTKIFSLKGGRDGESYTGTESITWAQNMPNTNTGRDDTSQRQTECARPQKQEEVKTGAISWECLQSI